MSNRPPFNALHVFCVVVREGSFRAAAAALSLTPGAVSRQIGLLEARLKVTLFERGSSGPAMLTPAGHRLHERAADRIEGLLELLDGESHSGRKRKLLVDTSVTLAMYWLIPQLRLFGDRHPGTLVQVRTADGDIDPASPADVFIRREPSELRGLPAQPLMMERSVLVAGAEFSREIHERRGAGPLAFDGDLPRIGMRSRPDLWPAWGNAHGRLALEPTLLFDNTVLAIQATLQGLGVLVVPEIFVAEMLASGSLCRLHPLALETGHYAFAVGRTRDSMRVRQFTDWLSAQATGAGGEPPPVI